MKDKKMPEKKKNNQNTFLLNSIKKKTAKTEILAVFLWGQTQKGPGRNLSRRDCFGPCFVGARWHMKNNKDSMIVRYYPPVFKDVFKNV
jgi:hypothetical protein